MKLFELTNGRTGESYVRCYAWAASEEQARILYGARHGGEPATVAELFDESSRPFVTDLSDDGSKFGGAINGGGDSGEAEPWYATGPTARPTGDFDALRAARERAEASVVRRRPAPKETGPDENVHYIARA